MSHVDRTRRRAFAPTAIAATVLLLGGGMLAGCGDGNRDEADSSGCATDDDCQNGYVCDQEASNVAGCETGCGEGGGGSAAWSGTTAGMCDDICAEFPDEQQADCVAACEDASGSDGGGVMFRCEDYCSSVPDADRADCMCECEGDVECDSTRATPTGVCRPAPAIDNDAGADTDSPADVDWAGTWLVDVIYSVTCEVPLQPDETVEHRDSRIAYFTSDDGGGLTAVFTTPQDEVFRMSGVPTATGLTLAGSFPALSSRDELAGADPNLLNEIEIPLTDIASTSSASGTIRGHFVDGGAGAHYCTIKHGGTVTFSR